MRERWPKHRVLVLCRFIGLAWTVLSFFSEALTASPTTTWQRTTWNGERAWEATSSDWTAVVSEERARLVSLAETKHGENLLYATLKSAVSWGGHRCWLGPQSEWKGGWPPLTDWEASAAAGIEVSGTLLTITHPHTDASYPALSRSYEWRDGVLHCNLSWQGGHHYAIHILQIPRWSVVHVRRAVTKDLPLGYGMPQLFGPKDTLTDVALPIGVARVDGDQVTLWHANQSEKVAFEPQELTADIGSYQLKMLRGASSSVMTAAPNLGLTTQVFLGDWENPFVEIEQLSPFGNQEQTSSEILIEPSRLKSSPE